MERDDSTTAGNAAGTTAGTAVASSTPTWYDPVPDFGRHLGPVLAEVGAEERPAFLAMLERTAADRYRAWADAWPDHRGPLLECAASEDEIADRIDAAFPCDAETRARLVALLPTARVRYYELFDGHPVAEQLRMQAHAELQGAAAWRHIAERLPEDERRQRLVDVLASCSELEERSSAVVRTLLGLTATTD
jgi:hypothetical protein